MPKGFNSLTPEQRREIASMGGRAVHAKGVGHKFDSATAAEAGRKSGESKRRRKQQEAQAVE